MKKSKTKKHTELETAISEKNRAEMVLVIARKHGRGDRLLQKYYKRFLEAMKKILLFSKRELEEVFIMQKEKLGGWGDDYSNLSPYEDHRRKKLLTVSHKIDILVKIIEEITSIPHAMILLTLPTVNSQNEEIGIPSYRLK